MSGLFESIKQGLSEAVEFERGNLPGVRFDKITISPVHKHSGSEVKAIRLKLNMTQKLFAATLGVSSKTVEAWESGINPPSGSANRMLELLSRDDDLLERCAIVARH